MTSFWWSHQTDVTKFPLSSPSPP